MSAIWLDEIPEHLEVRVKVLDFDQNVWGDSLDTARWKDILDGWQYEGTIPVNSRKVTDTQGVRVYKNVGDVWYAYYSIEKKPHRLYGRVVWYTELKIHCDGGPLKVMGSRGPWVSFPQVHDLDI
jgi:hypothetical protein